MAIYHQKRDVPGARQLRREGGAWLKRLREQAGHTQRSFAALVGAEYYTLISQIENGRGRVPPEHYRLYAEHLGVEPRAFIQGIIRHYDPFAHELLFGELPRPLHGGDEDDAVLA